MSTSFVPAPSQPVADGKDSQIAARVPLSGYVPALDGVRGFAILWVLFLHFFGHMEVTNGFDAVLRRLSVTGIFSIDLFFMLSGFLITGILWDSKKKPAFFRNFFMRRFLRIFPLYYGVLAIIFFVLPQIPWFRGPELSSLVDHQAWAWTYMVNFFLAKSSDWGALPYISHFWSLAVEEHFYFLWPFIVFYTSRKALLRLCLALAAFSLLLRFGILLDGAHTLADFVLTPCRLDTLCMGAFLAVLIRRDANQQQWVGILKRTVLWLIPISLGLIGVSEGLRAAKMLDLASLPRQLGYLLCMIGFFVWAITAAPGTLVNRLSTNRLFKFFGKYSYGLYIFHNPLPLYFAKIGLIAWLTAKIGSYSVAVVMAAALGIGLSLLVAMASYHGYEQHFLKFKVFFGEKKPSPSPEAKVPLVVASGAAESPSSRTGEP